LKDFDAVVIGAGLGGISATATLAKAGKKVLLLENHNVPGGYATSFTRGRFEFDVALHALSGVGSEKDRGPIWKLLENLGVAQKIKYLQIPELFKGYYPDFELILPVGRSNYEDALCQQFPREKEGIKKFVAELYAVAEQGVKANRIGMKAVMADPKPYSTLLAHYGKTLEQVLNPLVKDEKARAVLGQIWGYFLLPPSKLSFMIYALGTVEYLRFGVAHVQGTSQSLSQAFIDVAEENGGQVWLNNGASRILTSKGRIKGVITKDGTEIATQHVICNANPVTVALQLIGRENIPQWYLNRLGAWSGGASVFNVYLGVDCKPYELGLDVHENFINISYDLEQQYESMRNSVDFQPDGVAMTAFGVNDSTVAPANASTIAVTSVAYGEPWLKLKPDEYYYAKNRLAARVLKLLERAAPGLSDHIEVIEVSTPLTNMRYTNNPGGSIIGFDENFQGTGHDRLPIRGPVEGLYFGGAWVNIGGGFEAAMISGAQAAHEAMNDMEKGRWDASAIARVKTIVEKQISGTHEIKNPFISQGRLLSAIHPGHLSLKVKEIIDETATTKTLRMVSSNGKLPVFKAGQYVNLFVKIGKTLTSRPYSISSAPGRSYLDLTVRKVASGFVSDYLLKKVSEGDEFESTGPSGNFFYEPLIDSTNLVFLAGGSGITPFMSIIRDAVARKLPLKIHLLYGSRKPNDIIFKKELDRIAAKNANIKVDYIISEPPSNWKGATGFLDTAVIKKLVGSINGKTFYICGPAPMYALCEPALQELGVTPRRIRKEVYGPLACVSDEKGWPKQVDLSAVYTVIEERTGRKIKAKAGEPLIVSLERSGIVIPALCRSGECTACRTRLISGKVFIPERVHRRLTDVKSGYIHPCMTYPLDNLSIRI